MNGESTADSDNRELDQLRAEVASLQQLLDVYEATVVEQSKRLEDSAQALAAQNELLKSKNIDLEQEMRRAENATNAKSQFLANMSHELRTPMNAIISYSEMLMEEAEDLEQKEFIPDLKKILGAGNHLLALINDILDLSKIEAGKMELFLETFELPPFVDEIESTVDALIKKNGNTFTIECDESLGSMHADLTKVRQAIFNLISNAAKFTKNGAIKLRVERLSEDPTERVRFTVADSGIGIPADRIENLFEEFAQADASTTRKFGGTGLGLTISLRFCQMMGGNIEAASEPGKGSTFTITLPAYVTYEDPEAAAQTAPPAQASGAEKPAKAPKNADRCVLVIDDDASARDIIERTLDSDGFTVVTAAGGEEGLKLAAKLHPLAITLDVLMPGMDGWSVLRTLKNDPKLRDIPVIMISMLTDRNMGYTLGSSEFMTKPIDRNRLREILKKFATPDPPHRVLIVDDDPNIHDLMGRMLEKEGWTVAGAENGQVALDNLDQYRPTLILLDLLMPVMDGFEFLLRLRERENGSSIPVIVLTAKTITAEERKLLNGQVRRIMEKSGYNRAELTRMVREAVSSQVG